MARAQLRIYRIEEGRLDEFARRFSEEIVPARRSHGFEVIGPWTHDAANEFVWVVTYHGTLSWDDAVEQYYDSPERRSIGFDPNDYIEHMDTRMLREA